MAAESPIPERQADARGAPTGALGELNGAVADLGVMLPYALGLIAAGLVSPAAVFAGFGIGYLASAVTYRAPVPVQPMKALGVIALAGGLSASGLMLSGVAIGICLIALGASGAARRIARLTPQSVSAGLQLGLGGMLALFAFAQIETAPVIGVAALAALLLMMRAPRLPAALVLVLGAGAASYALHGLSDAPIPEATQVAALSWSALSWSALGAELWPALSGGVLPQLPMTLANAVLVTAALARDLFPERSQRVTETRLCLTSGALNLALCPLGALPMCHGAGGLAAHHRFGARGGLGIGLLGLALLLAAAAPAGTTLAILALAPAAVLGALLLMSAVELGSSPRLWDATPSCKAVIALTALVVVFLDPFYGVLVGIVAEALRRWLVRRLFAAPAGVAPLR